MSIVVLVILFIVFSIVKASGEDWERGQYLSDRRTKAIISAIYGASDEITSEYRYSNQDQIDYFERFNKDTENEKVFKDNHGRYKRERLVYDTEGNIIAKEIIEVAE